MKSQYVSTIEPLRKRFRMFDPEHLEIATKGKEAVILWRAANPGKEFCLSYAKLSEVDLSGTDLSKTSLHDANLVKMKMTNTIFENADFSKAVFDHSDLSNASLVKAHLVLSSFTDVNLFKAKFNSAFFLLSSFFDCNFESSDFSDSDHAGGFYGKCNFKDTVFVRSNLKAPYFAFPNFSKANFCGAYLGGITVLSGIMDEADFTDVRMRTAVLSDTDLSKCKGLEKVNHLGPSTIGFDTLEKTFRGAGCVISPEFKTFAINAGVPIQVLEDLPRILAEVKYCSCFICYGQPDLKFAQTLKEELSAKGVTCWLYDTDMTPGKKTWGEISLKRREAEKMIVICSIRALVREGMKKEIEEQMDEDESKIVPISLDNDWKADGFQVERGDRDLKPFLLERNYANFQSQDFKKALNSLLKGIMR